MISHQGLSYPATDMTAHDRPAEPAATSLFLSQEEMTAYRRMYLGPDGDPADPMASPLLADDHGKLPPALIQVAEHDPLRQDGVRYAAALRAAGVPVRLTTYVGMPHGFLNFPGLSRSAPQAAAELCAEQALALATPEAGHGMNLISHLVQRQLGLDPPLTRDLLIERDLPVPMPDGTVLLADRWAPRTGGDKLPVALARTPYGRGALMTEGPVRPLAERGFQVILQSVRGTFGSGGVFEPMRNEREDGLATLEWVVNQPWFGDSIVLVGASYLGYAQWAVADRLPPEVKAMIPQVTDAALTLDFLRPDSYSLETPFGLGVLTRRAGTPPRRGAGPAGRRQDAPRDVDPAAGRGRRRRHRPPLRLYPGHPPPRRRRPLLGRDRPPPPGGGDDRPGQLGRRLVRRLPAGPAP